MNRVVRLAGYCIICLFTFFPLLLTAQEKQGNELTTDTTITYTEDEEEDTEADTTRTETPLKQHYLWDQDVPISSDSLGENEYDGYEGGSLVLRKVPAKLQKELNADKKLQYDKREQERLEEQARSRNKFRFLQLFISGLFALIHAYRWVFVIIIACALVILLLVFLKGRGFVFNFRKTAKEEEIQLTDEELDLDTYEKQIREAIVNNQLRLAVRLLYLQTLRLLADKEVISYSKGKTNATYLRAMAQTVWYKAFANLTLDYEYIWYGEVPVNEAQFNVIHSRFSQFMNELGYTR